MPLRFARLVLVLAFPALTEPAPAVTPAEAADWLKTVGAAAADAKGFVAPTAESIPEIRWVSFARVPAQKLNTADLAKLGALPKLEEVVFGGNAASDAGVEALAKAVPKLRRLWVFRSGVTDRAFVHIAGLAELETLHMAGTKVTPAGMIELVRLKKLHTIELDDTAIGDDGLDAIKVLPSLREVSFQTMRGVGPRGMNALAAMRRLEILNLAFAEIETLEPLAGSRSLRELYLQRATIDGERAAGIAKLKTLRTLSLAYTGVTDASLHLIATLPQLSTLHLIGTPVSDEGVKALAMARALEELDLSGTAAGDPGLVALAALPKLKTLVLRNTRITDAGLDALALSPSLTHLDVANTHVTAQAAAKLAASKPKLTVVHEP